MILEVQDHGRGMPLRLLTKDDQSVSQMGVGVMGMKERMRQLGGHLEFASSSGGTTVRAIAPMTRKKLA